MALQEYDDKIDDWVSEFLRSPKNLASEQELREQGKVALKYFIDADLDGSQSLNFQELKRLCDDMGLPMGNDEEEALAKIDKDGSGCLDIDEWTRWWLGRISSLPNPAKQQEALATNTFKRIDVDGSGYLDVGEFSTLLESLGAQFSSEELSQALDEIDTDHSGVIECSEFVSWWTHRTLSSRSSSSLVSLKLRKLAAKASQIFYKDIFSAVWEGNTDLVKSFIESEKRLVQASDESEYGGGWKPLHYACYKGFIAIVEMLLDAGASVNATNDCGFTPLFYASQRGHIDVCSILMDRGADPSMYGSNSEDDDIFLCPADFVSDEKALRAIFKSHAKSQAPGKLSSEDFSASLSASTGQLRINVKLDARSLSKLSALPITKWKISLSFDSDGSHSCDLIAKGLNPKKEQLISIIVPDKKWLSMLNWQYSNALFEEVELQESTSKGLTVVWKKIKGIFNSINPSFQRRVRLDEKLLSALERGPASGDGAAIVLRKNVRVKMIAAGGNGQLPTNDSQGDAPSPAPTTVLTMEQIDEIITAMGSSSTASIGNKVSTSSKTTTSVPPASAPVSKKVVPPSTSTKTTTSQSSRPKSASATSSMKSSKQNERVEDDPHHAKVAVWIKLAAINGMFEGEMGDEIAVDVAFPSLTMTT